MTEIAVENELCSACGADVRAEALFCYNCGGALQEESGDKSSGEAASDVWLRGELEDKTIKAEVAADESGETKQAQLRDQIEAKTETAPVPIEKGNDTESVSDVPSDEGAIKVETKKKPIAASKMKTAASLRKRPKPVKRNKVKVVWKEKESSINVWFVVGSILITLLVGTLFFLAVYLK